VPFRTEHVGSLLRPAALREARRDFAAGAIDAEALRAAEDDAVLAALRAQDAIGIDVVTDGEFRRADFRAGLAAAVTGLREEVFDRAWRSGDSEVTVKSRVWRVEGPVTQTAPIAADEAAFLASNASVPFKVTLPSPGYVAERFFDPGTYAPYASVAELAETFVRILGDEIAALVELGVPYVQLDNPGYATFLDGRARTRLSAKGRDPDRAFREMLAADRALLESVPREHGTTYALHVCRGNNASSWQHEGDYDPVAEELFGSLPVDRLLLEYDDERSGGFECLRFVPAGTVAVLGLISTKVATVESPTALLRRLGQASAYIDADRLALSPQCGFATHADGANAVATDAQYAKLAVAVETAHRFFDGR